VDAFIAWLFANVDKIGVIFLLVAGLYGGARRWWVFGWVYAERVAECEQEHVEAEAWKRLALRGTAIAEASVEVAEHVPKAKGRADAIARPRRDRGRDAPRRSRTASPTARRPRRRPRSDPGTEGET
jgi:hypothetical protein